MIKNKKLAEWVQEVAAMCRPDHIHWCDGSERGIPTDVAVNGPRRHRDVDGCLQAAQQHLCSITPR